MIAADRRIAVGLFVVSFVTYAWFFAGGGWNQNAHFDLARALVERQTLHIDGYRANTGDISWSPAGGQWRAYINKAPGVSFLAAIPYAAVYFAERAAHAPIDSWKVMTINAWVVTALTCGVCGALIPVVLFFWARKRGIVSSTATAVAFTIAFGTIVFPYSTTLFAQVPAALFLLLAVYWLDERPLLAGIAAGLAGACFYLCIPLAVMLTFFAGRRNALRVVAGGLPFGILLGAYHNACFGSPFRTSVEVSKGFTEAGLLFGVFRVPSLEALWGLTFSEYRGLFLVSPVLLLAFAGAFVMWRQRRRELLLVASLIGVNLLVAASFNQWTGGFAFGPRYLLPVVPLFGIPLCFVRRRAVLAVLAVLAVISIAVQFIATSVNPTPDSAIRQPLRAYLLPAFRGGEVSSNTQTVDELIPHFLYKPGSNESAWAAANFGEALTGRPGRRASVVPIGLWMIVGSALLFTRWRPPANTIPTVIVLVVYAIAGSNGTMHFRTVTWSESYYASLAEGFRSGHLSMAHQPDPRLIGLANPYTPETRWDVPALWDASYFEGKYYLHVSPVPVVLLYMPVHLLSGLYPSDEFAATLFASLAFLMIVALLRRAIDEARRGLWILLAGVGNAIPYVLVASSFHQAAIACAMFFGAAWAYALLRFLETPRPWLAAVSGACVGLAIATRPNLIVLLLAAILAVILSRGYGEGPSLRQEGRSFASLRMTLGSLTMTLCAFLLPLLLIGAMAAVYNYARFRSPFESGASYQITAMSLRGRSVCRVCTPREVARLVNGVQHYLLWAPSIVSEFPFVEVQPHRLDPKVSYPGPPEPMLGIGATTPLVLFGSLFAVILALQRAPKDAATRAGLLLMAAGWLVMLALSSCWWVIARDALDFTLLMIGGTAIVVERTLTFFAEVGLRVVPLRIVFAVLAVYSIVLGLLLPLSR